VVPRRIAVGRVVPVPRREIQTRLESVRATRVGELAHDVPMTVSKRARGDGMRSRLRWPETEAIVMLRRENERSRSGRTRGARPLPRVEVGWREDRRVLTPVAPLAVGERVDAEMKKERQLVALPVELRRRRTRARC